MDRVTIITPDRGFVRVACLARVGDWAVTQRKGHLPAITHVPTGACVQGLADSEMLPAHHVLAELDRLPRFDLQTFDAHEGSVHATLVAGGLRGKP
jgi:hypothetical protein